jgi:DNA-directed RNA polymerase subunit RPC12/RpoP
MPNRTLVMELVGEPDSGAAVVTSRSLPVLSGTGSTDYACGACQAVLAASLKLGEIEGAMIRCPACGRVNRPK